MSTDHNDGTTRTEGTAESGSWNWQLILGTGAVMGLTWAFLFPSGNLQFLAGLPPVVAGYYIGRRVEHRPVRQAFMAALVGMIIGALASALYLYVLMPGTEPLIVNNQEVTREALLLTQLMFGFFVFPFAPYGAFMSTKGKQQRKKFEEEAERRGGRLQHPGRVRSIDDLRTLSLPKLGAYVSEMFKKQGFKVEDYRFERSEYVDLTLTYKGEQWLVRCTVEDKVKQGVVQSLAQTMKADGIPKGVLITSTELSTEATKWAAKRGELVAIDGETLLMMNEG